jgi:hypothetical protein
MNNFKTDVAVALVFFNRPECLQRVFEAIKSARPSQLFLIQDGPRENKPNDSAKILECRAIVEQVDWQCEMHKDYSNANLGCGKRIYTGISNAFKYTDKLVIIEDDILIGDDMLPFCKEMLDRYESDERIGIISGMNHLGKYTACPYSYLFASGGGAIWGWATWKRVWNNVEWNLDCAQDSYAISALQSKKNTQPLIMALKDKVASMQRGEKQTSWSFQFGFSACYMQNTINIIPTRNLISNIGISADSVHSVSDIHRVPRGLRVVYNAPRYCLNWPLSHPKYVVDDQNFVREQEKIMGKGFWRSKYRRFETILYRVLPFLGK